MKFSWPMLGIMLALLIQAPVLAQPQQAPAVEPPQRAIISYLVPVDSNTVNQLLTVVNNQIKAGVKAITILISSPGGDTTAAFAAYNVLKIQNQRVPITTFNVGNVDSAAVILYCSGMSRYSFRGTRFLIHGNSLTMGVGIPMDALSLDSQLQQLKNLNQMTIQVISTITKKKEVDIESAVRGQTILTPEQAQEWGIVQQIKDTFMEPGAQMVSIEGVPSVPLKDPFQFASVSPQGTSKSAKHTNP